MKPLTDVQIEKVVSMQEHLYKILPVLNSVLDFQEDDHTWEEYCNFMDNCYHRYFGDADSFTAAPDVDSLLNEAREDPAVARKLKQIDAHLDELNGWDWPERDWNPDKFEVDLKNLKLCFYRAAITGLFLGTFRGRHIVEDYVCQPRGDETGRRSEPLPPYFGVP